MIYTLFLIPGDFLYNFRCEREKDAVGNDVVLNSMHSVAFDSKADFDIVKARVDSDREARGVDPDAHLPMIGQA